MFPPPVLVRSSKSRSAPSRRRRTSSFFALALLLFTGGVGAAAKEKPANSDDLLIVDCLLPAKVRRLGRQARFLAPRQPVRTTALDCRIRGGEYTEPDQATYATALQVWLPRAQEGDLEAQFHVGRIFERGLGIAPDYESAAMWYRRAAEADHAPSQVSLGYLYEEGLGVETDALAALNWYRRAAGLAESMVVLEESELAALREARGELERRAEEAETLRREVEELQRQLEEFEAATEEEEARRESLESVTQRLAGELAAKDDEVRRSRVRIATLEESIAAVVSAAPGPPAPGPTASGPTAPAAQGSAAGSTAPRSALEFGRYRALVIGNTDHAQLPRLATASADAREVARVLEKKYGFEVELLLDATRYQIMTALNGLREELTAKDNLLVYYAGHSVQEGEQAYWQPVDAEPGSPANWIPSEVVTEHLDLVPAQHLFLVADSAYSGLRTRSAVAQLPTGMTDEERFFHIRLLLDKRSRLVLKSGANAPTAGSGDGDRSRFSSALLEVLEENDGILEASRVFHQVSDRLRSETGQVPEFAPMRWARSNVSDFFFVAEGSQ